MLKNYFKTAWRTILRSKGYTALNIFGLSMGLAVALLIGIWAYHEYSYDKFLPANNRLYQVRRNFNSNGEILTFPTTSFRLADALRQQVPEIEYVAESDWFGQHGLMVGDKKLNLTGAITGKDFLKIFQYPLLQGNAKTVFADPYSIVLTESAAMALFSNTNPVNKMVRFENSHDLKVTGILKDPPSNSSFQFKFIVPISYYEAQNPRAKENHASFGNNGLQQFVLLKENADAKQVSAKIKDIEKTEKGNSNAMLSDVILQAFTNRHLYGNYVNGIETAGFVVYVRMFSLIGALVLLIACINFINLTTARSEKRAREVGVRKAIGSRRKQLILQFLTESFLLTCFSTFFSLIFVQLTLPSFNALTNNSLSIPFSNPFFWLILFGGICLTALLAGSRPAFYLSSFNPVHVLKGNKKTGHASTLSRKILVVTQFSCSIALVISTIVIYRQVQYVKNRPTGYSINRLLVTGMNADLTRNFTSLKNDLLNTGIADAVTTASSPATNVYWHSDVDQWPGKNAGETIEMGTVLTTPDYFKTLGMTFIAGRDYRGPQDSLCVIFNEAAIQRMRINNPVNQEIIWQGNKLRIIGVAKDALMVSPFTSADPTMFLLSPQSQGPQGNLIYRLSPAVNTQDAVSRLTALFNKYEPAYPYAYQFEDANYAGKFKLELLIGKLSGVFAGLAIFISCLGLFGLAAYVAEQRTKEIGIRKVLGASISQVWVMLSKDFILLVGISCVIATPVSLYFLQGWLVKYPYRISIGAGVFLVAALLALLITLITISFQAIQAALANPVKSLRSE